jgi:hypothetical protein
MKVLDLSCTHGHVFEGWFASEEDYAGQRSSGLLQCPVCGDTAVEKRLSAPRLNLAEQPRAARQTRQADEPELAAQGAQTSTSAQSVQSLQGQWLRAMREVMARTEDVGERFVDEARRMHYGETEERNIRGRASREETAELLEEGIAVLPLPRFDALDGPLQ